MFFPRDYDAEFDAVFGARAGVRPGRRPTRRSSSPRADDPAVRPAGHEAWFVLVNAPPHGTGVDAVDWRRPGLADAYADRVLDVLAARGLDVRDRLLFREIRTPADLAAATGAPGGAIYGTAGPAACCARPTAARWPGCSWSAAPSTRAAGCRWSPCPREIVADQIGPA